MLPNHKTEKKARKLWKRYRSKNNNERFWKRYEGLVETAKQERETTVARLLTKITTSKKTGDPNPKRFQIPITVKIDPGQKNIYQKQLYKRYRLKETTALVLGFTLFVAALEYNIADPTLFMMFFAMMVFNVAVNLGDTAGKVGAKSDIHLTINHLRIMSRGKGMKPVSVRFSDIASLKTDKHGLAVVTRSGETLYIPCLIAYYDEIKAHLEKVMGENG